MSLAAEDRLSTGIKGLDEILHGGVLPGNAYLVRGGPGTGKTTLGLHFLQQGLAQGTRSLFVTLMEPGSNVRKNAQQQGFDLDELHFLDFSPSHDLSQGSGVYDVFPSVYVEQEPLMEQLISTSGLPLPTGRFLGFWANPGTNLRGKAWKNSSLQARM